MKIVIALPVVLLLSAASTAPDPNIKLTKRAIADLRTLGAVMESYAEDHAAYPGFATIKEMELVMVPKYVTGLTAVDPWGTEYRYLVSPDRRHYRVISAGADRVFEKQYEELTSEPPADRASDNFNDDFVFQDGRFRSIHEMFKKLFEAEDYRAPAF